MATVQQRPAPSPGPRRMRELHRPRPPWPLRKLWRAFHVPTHIRLGVEDHRTLREEMRRLILWNRRSAAKGDWLTPRTALQLLETGGVMFPKPLSHATFFLTVFFAGAGTEDGSMPSFSNSRAVGTRMVRPRRMQGMSPRLTASYAPSFPSPKSLPASTTEIVGLARGLGTVRSGLVRIPSGYDGFKSGLVCWHVSLSVNRWSNGKTHSTN